MEQNTQDSGEIQEVAAPPVTESEVSAPQEERHVPLAALEAERQKRQARDEEFRVVNDHVRLLEREINSLKEQKKEPEEDLSDDDFLTKRYVDKLTKKFEQQLSERDQILAEEKFARKHPDYEEVVTKFLPEVLKEHPGLRDTLQNSRDFSLAYQLAKGSDAYRKANEQPKVSEDARRMVENAQKPGSLSSVGKSSAISEARRFKEMSDEEFRAFASRQVR